MARKIEEIDIAGLAEVASIAEEVQRTGEPKRLTKNGQDIAIITPAPARRRRKTGIITESDPLLELMGIGHGRIPGGVSGRKNRALLDAKRAKTGS